MSCRPPPSDPWTVLLLCWLLAAACVTAIRGCDALPAPATTYLPRSR